MEVITCRLLYNYLLEKQLILSQTEQRNVTKAADIVEGLSHSANCVLIHRSSAERKGSFSFAKSEQCGAC